MQTPSESTNCPSMGLFKQERGSHILGGYQRHSWGRGHGNNLSLRAFHPEILRTCTRLEHTGPMVCVRLVRRDLSAQPHLDAIATSAPGVPFSLLYCGV